MVQNTFHTDALEVRQLLSWQMIPYAVFLIGLPTALILAAVPATVFLGAGHAAEAADLNDPVKKEIAQLEARIAELEQAQKKAEGELADPALYNDFARAKPIMDAHREAKTELEGLYGRWEEAQTRLAALQQAEG